MEFGVCVPHYGKPVDIERILGVARSAEELGFASVWVTDHLFVPRTMDIIYRDNMLEPLALLSHLAAVVPRVRLGTSVIILPYRNPIIVAKMLATIDQLSHGRLIFGAAVGWMEEEFNALKVPFEKRGALSDESLRIIREIWTHGVVNHQGTFYQYEDMQASPNSGTAGIPAASMQQPWRRAAPTCGNCGPRTGGRDNRCSPPVLSCPLREYPTGYCRIRRALGGLPVCQ
jgi:alkanesulfonate monooxygenase SsuD/methylene tetrahydromethanopterin reductase-like flavin-dependent oxidoreductase (luciferase family)